MADSEPGLRVELTEAFRLRRRYVARGLAKMRERSELAASVDPEALSEFVISAIQGALLLSATEKDGDVLRHTLDQVLARLRSLVIATDGPGDSASEPDRE